MRSEAGVTTITAPHRDWEFALPQSVADSDISHPEHEHKMHLVSDLYLYDYAPFAWTVGWWKGNWTWFSWVPLESSVEFWGWAKSVPKWSLNLFYVAFRLIVLAVLVGVELLVMLPIGLIFYTNGRGVTVVAGLILALPVLAVIVIAIVILRDDFA